MVESVRSTGGGFGGLRVTPRGCPTLNPVATAAVNGAPTADQLHYGCSRPDLGMNVRWGHRHAHAQQHRESGLLAGGSRRRAVPVRPAPGALLPRQRPFFLDGTEQFATPNNLIYARRVVAPLAATRLTGRVSKSTSVAYLMAVDDAATSATGQDHPVFNILRRRALESRDRRRHAAGLEGRLPSANAGAASRTDTGITTLTAPLWQATFNRASIKIANQVTTYGAPGSLVERFTSDIVVDRVLRQDQLSLQAVAVGRPPVNTSCRPVSRPSASRPTRATRSRTSTICSRRRPACATRWW